MAELKKTTTKKAATGTAGAARKPRAPKASSDKPEKAKKSIHAEAQEILAAEVAEASAPAVAAASGVEFELNTDGKYYFGVGRRKTSTANVRVYPGAEKHVVNKRDFDTYFGSKFFIAEALKPLQLTGTDTRVHLVITVKGGGKHSQAQAVAHGISRALAGSSREVQKVLKKNGLMTRDSRMKERKKPGLKRARRGPQWAKR